ncbi:MAG: hypothetical protein ACFNVZ_11565, partial [Prevotella melaninogenica]
MSKRKFTGWGSLQSQSEVTDKSQLTKETQPYLQSINNSSDGTTEFTSQKNNLNMTIMKLLLSKMQKPCVFALCLFVLSISFSSCAKDDEFVTP